MNELNTLLMVAQARYDQQRQVFTKIVKEESVLRAELDRISGLNRTSNHDPEAVGDMQMIGADLLWKAWLSRSRTTLNHALARVLARKSLEQDRMRKAFGKVAALETLIQAEQKKRRKRFAQASLDEVLLQSISRSPKDQ